MGVYGLWRLLDASGKPVPLETLEGKVLAIDVSIWIHQVLQGYQDRHGNPKPNAHLFGLFNRICKLLYYKIKPVFVFDGGVPMLKKNTIASRRKQKSIATSKAQRMKADLINNLIKHKAVKSALTAEPGSDSQTQVPSGLQSKSVVNDMFKLPDLPPGFTSTVPEEVTDDEYDSDSSSSTLSPRKQTKWIGNIHNVDVASAEFKALPPDVRYDILTDLKETRKQNSWGRLHEMPEESQEFSGYQMRRLLKRRLVQECLESVEKEMGGKTLTLDELEKLMTEQGIDTNRDDTAFRIAADSTTRLIYISDKNALQRASSRPEVSSIEEEGTSKEGGSNEPEPVAGPSRGSEPEAVVPIHEDMKEYHLDEDDDWDSDCCEYIRTYDLEDGSLDRKSLYDIESEADPGLNESRPLSRKYFGGKNVLNPALTYMLEYSGLSDSQIMALLEQNHPDTIGKGRSKSRSPLQFPSLDTNTKNSSGNGEKTSTLVKEQTKIESSKSGRIEILQSKDFLGQKSRNSVKDDGSRSDGLDNDLLGQKSRNSIKDNVSQSDKMALDCESRFDELKSRIKNDSIEIIDESRSKVKNDSIEIIDESRSRIKKDSIEIIDESRSKVKNDSIEIIDDTSKNGGGEKCEDVKVVVESETTESDSDDFIEIQDVPVPEAVNTSRSSREEGFQITIKSDERIEDDLFADVFVDIGKRQVNLESIIEETKLSREKESPDKKETTTNDNVAEKAMDKKPALESNLKIFNSVEEIERTENEKTDNRQQIESGNSESVEEADVSGKEVVELEPEKEVAPPVPMTEEELQSLKARLEEEQEDLAASIGKLERQATDISDQIRIEAQELLRLFGIPYIVAPMEAEAQCAYLEQIRLTDGTITDDSDIWLFGGQCVYKNFFNNNKRVQQFLSCDIQHHFKLTRNEMIQLALLVGSDYTVGIPGVGPVTALEILAAFPAAGDNLLHGLTNFCSWLKGGRVVGPGKGSLRNKLRNVQVDKGFPSQAVVQAYLFPTVDESRESFTWGKPNVVLLGDYAKRKFGWTKAKFDEIMNPVMKRIEEKRSQKPIEAYFKVSSVPKSIEATLSKRIQKAVLRLNNEDTNELEEETPREDGKKGRRNVSKRKTQQDSKDVHDAISPPKIQATGEKNAEEYIPQRERDRAEALKKKLHAIEVVRKSRRGLNKTKKVKRCARKVTKEAELSESDSSSS